MGKLLTKPEFIILRDPDRCINCRVCERQCSFDAQYFDEETDTMGEVEEKCVACQRCVDYCPTNALAIKEHDSEFKTNSHWTSRYLKDLYRQADSGGVLLTGMGCDRDYRIYWDHMILDASQVTNPSIDPLREPMELRTYLGRKPDSVKVEKTADGKLRLKEKLPPQLKLEAPILFSAMSYGSISYNVCESLARAASEFGTFYNTGEGGLHKNLYQYGENTIVQVASGRFGIQPTYLNQGVAVEIKVGQGAKPGIGGHLPGQKVSDEISITRMIPKGSDAISPAPHHDIYSIEDLRQLIYALKEVTNYEKPISVKIAAVHNSAAIASGMVRAGADIIVLDGLRGGTGAAPTRLRDNVGIPIELALAAVDQRLREEGIRGNASLVMASGIRCSSDVVKAIALGADAVYIGSAALIALGCTMCHKCYTGRCAWGLTTQNPYLTKRVNPDTGAKRLVNLLNAWSHEIKEILGGMGLNSIESLRGSRIRLRGIDLSDRELKILGIQHAGE